MIQTGMTVVTGGFKRRAEQAPVSLLRGMGTGNCRGRGVDDGVPSG